MMAPNKKLPRFRAQSADRLASMARQPSTNWHDSIMGIKVLFLYKKPSYFCLSFLERKEKYYWCWFLVPKVFCSVSVSVHGSRPAKMRGGRQAACRHGPARHFSLNTLFFISFQPTNLASTPPPSLILDTTHITKVTLRESPRVTPTQPPLQTRCFPTRENCSSSSSSGNLLSSCAGRRPSTGSTWARWGSAAAIRQLRHDNNWWLSSILAHHLFWVWKKINVNNSKTDNTFLKISTNSRSDQIQRLEITSDIWCIQSLILSGFQSWVYKLVTHYYTHTDSVPKDIT